MRHWNMLKEYVGYEKVAADMLLASDAARLMNEAGAAPPLVTVEISHSYHDLKPSVAPAQAFGYVSTEARTADKALSRTVPSWRRPARKVRSPNKTFPIMCSVVTTLIANLRRLK